MRPSIIEKTFEHYFVECSYCEGSGEKYGLNDLSQTTCPVCSGQTVIQISIPAEMGDPLLIACSRCSGTGQEYGRDDLSMKRCPRCSGSGAEIIDST